MQTALADFIKDTPRGQEANLILRKCVHCGFCNANCPTYQLLGNELDGPRGRIYLMKQFLEGAETTASTRLHLDRCLVCRSCETTCPSGVEYSKLLDICRPLVESKLSRGFFEGLFRKGMGMVIPYSNRFKFLLGLGAPLRMFLPAQLRNKMPQRQTPSPWPAPTDHATKRQMLVLQGCVQQATNPNINASTARVLDKLGISLIHAPTAGCCGAMSLHMGNEDEARRFARQNIDAWLPYVENGVEAIVMTASGCGVSVKDYAKWLEADSEYKDKAAKVVALVKDLSEILSTEDLGQFKREDRSAQRIAFHNPCTLQHGQKIIGKVEQLLEKVGYQIVTVKNAHLCCGSAGTYSILQPKLSQQLLSNKIKGLEGNGPDFIATANIGCLLHLQTATRTPVKHWIELLADVGEFNAS